MLGESSGFKKLNIFQLEYTKESFFRMNATFTDYAIELEFLTVQKVTFKELYWLLVATIQYNPISQNYFEKKYSDLNLDLQKIHVILRIVSNKTYTSFFQYKIMNNAFLTLQETKLAILLFL